ncbi:MAG: acetolactate synthase small subunit, partial [Christensenellaceae bacterium]|nr:acetolactate synthase small subunit [Christensenellaceae bacterium]
VVVMEKSSSVFRELMLVKVWATSGSRAGLIEICNVFGATIVDLSPTTATIEMTANPSKNNSLLDLLEEYGIMEIARTGITGLQRGERHLSLD